MLPVNYTFEAIPSFLDGVFEYLNPSDYRRAAQVCRTWRACSQQEALIKRIFYQRFHVMPHPDIVKNKGWKAICQAKNNQMRNIREQSCHTFFYDEMGEDRSEVKRFDVSGGMNILERASGQNFVVDNFGRVVHEYKPSQRVLDAFDGLLAITDRNKADFLAISETDRGRGGFYFLPGNWRFPEKLTPRFLSRNSLLAFLTQPAEFGEHELSLCRLTLDEGIIHVEKIYTDSDEKLVKLIDQYAMPILNVDWRHFLFASNKAIYWVDLEKKKPEVVKLFEHDKRIEEWAYWNKRIYFSAQRVMVVFDLLQKKVVMKLSPPNFDKVWFRESYLFEYLPTSKTVMITNLEKGSVVGKWSVALPNGPSKEQYTIEKIEYIRGAFFCLYTGSSAMKTIVMYDMETKERIGLDMILYFDAKYGCYEQMSLKDGRLFVLMAGNEGAVVDFNKTPLPLEKAPRELSKD